MDRRRFVMASLADAVDWPLAAGAHQPSKAYRVGYLAPGAAAANARQHTAFIEGLRDRGWIEGKNITVEYRWDETDGNRLDALAAELARLPLDVEARDPSEFEGAFARMAAAHVRAFIVQQDVLRSERRRPLPTSRCLRR